MTTSYFCTPSSLPAVPTSHTLLALLQTAGLPATDVQTSNAYPGQVIIVTSSVLDAGQETQMNTTVAAWDPRPRVKRAVYQIYADLAALTTTQQTNVWNDISPGSPAKYLLDAGPNAAAIGVFDWVVRRSGATGAALLEAKLRAVAMYVQDNVSYLVAPTFDATINVAGDRPGS